MPVDGYGVGTAFYGETGTLFIGGGNEYKIADLKGKTIKEVKSDLKFETGNLLNPSENWMPSTSETGLMPFVKEQS